MDKLSFALIVPTLNPGPKWESWLAAFDQQKAKPSLGLVVDSSSEDGQLGHFNRRGFELVVIPRESFNHGATRQYAFERVRDRVNVVVFMTQDAVLADDGALERLLNAFRDPAVAAAYGRQLPHPDANPFGTHARRFNYGPVPMVKRLADLDRLGLKTCFFSNSFGAYRCDALGAIGGFPTTDFGEDMLAVARLLIDGRHIAYVAEACVHHSHDYSIRDEFWRYYSTGQFHKLHPWLLEAFGGATGEGARFVLSEARYLVEKAPHLLPAMGIRTLAKYLGYRLGKDCEFFKRP
jgi:rhamnosyltransferase